MEIKIYERNTKRIISKKNNKGLSFLYKTKIGRIILKGLTTKKVSEFNSHIIKSKLSKVFINNFVKKNNIDMSEYEEKEYQSFDDFFTRKIKPEKRVISKNLAAICDSLLSVYEIDDDLILNIKNSKYTIKELIKEENEEYKNGLCLVFRLCVDDYHHYIYLDDGTLLKQKKIDGILHTVNPIAFEKYKVFSENQREVSILKTKNYDEVIQIEVGALNIGKINNYNKNKFKKGEEKGYFSFGGSTIILLFKNNEIVIDDDILNNSKNGIETKVKLGEEIGVKYEKM